MDYTPWGNLYEYMKTEEGKKLTSLQIQNFFLQICQAVKYMHDNKLIHWDIKPENILISENLVPKLSDFGWSVLVSNKNRSTFCGTFEYMAPEMYENEEYSYSVDIWGLGVLLYEMFHKKSPFTE